MTGPLEDIGPNRHLNKWLGGAFFVIAALPLFIGLQPLTFLPRDQWGWAEVPVAIALVLIAIGVRFWMTRPINAATVTFRDHGFRLYVRQVFRGERQFDLNWTEISEVRKFDGGLYGGRLITFMDLDGRSIVGFSAAWTECSGHGVLERFEASAGAAGFRLEKRPMTLASVVQTRWTVSPADNL